MKEIKLFAFQKVMGWISLVAGIGFIGLGIYELIYSLGDGFSFRFPGDDWTGIINILMGLIVVGNYFQLRNYNRYFLKYNDQKVHFFLPEMNKQDTLHKSELRNLDVTYSAIVLMYSEDEKFIPVKSITGKSKERIKEAFEDFWEN